MWIKVDEKMVVMMSSIDWAEGTENEVLENLNKLSVGNYKTIRDEAEERILYVPTNMSEARALRTFKEAEDVEIETLELRFSDDELGYYEAEIVAETTNYLIVDLDGEE